MDFVGTNRLVDNVIVIISDSVISLFINRNEKQRISPLWCKFMPMDWAKEIPEGALKKTQHNLVSGKNKESTEAS